MPFSSFCKKFEALLSVKFISSELLNFLDVCSIESNDSSKSIDLISFRR